MTGGTRTPVVRAGSPAVAAQQGPCEEQVRQYRSCQVERLPGRERRAPRLPERERTQPRLHRLHRQRQHEQTGATRTRDPRASPPHVTGARSTAPHPQQVQGLQGHVHRVHVLAFPARSCRHRAHNPSTGRLVRLPHSRQREILQVTALGAQRVAGTDPAPMAFRRDHALLDPAAFLGGELEQKDPRACRTGTTPHTPVAGEGPATHADPRPCRHGPGRIVSHTKPP